jgi:hypothetical protein
VLYLKHALKVVLSLFFTIFALRAKIVKKREWTRA